MSEAKLESPAHTKGGDASSRSPRDVIVDPAAPPDAATSPEKTLKRARPTEYDDDSVDSTLHYLLGRAFDSLEAAPGSLVTLQRVMEITRTQTNAVLWRGVGGPADTSTLSGCRWASATGDGVFFHAVNAVAEERFSKRLRRFEGKKARTGKNGCGKWHLADVGEC